MKLWIALLAVAIALSWNSISPSAEKTAYPPPRFPSYLKPPKSIDEVMPFARAAVRQTGGRTPLGLVEKGTVLIVTDSIAEDMVMQSIKRAYEERGIKVQIVPEYDLVGISKDDARKAKEAMRGYTSEQGYMEAERWINSRFADPEVPKKWLKERRPDDWSPYMPGINAPGRYEDYAKDPWKTQVMVMKKIEDSSYEYFYPALRKR